VSVTARATGWPVMVGVVEVGVVDTRYGVSQPGADAERYRCACLHCTQRLAGRGDWYQCGLDWGRSSLYTTIAAAVATEATSTIPPSDVDSIVVASVSATVNVTMLLPTNTPTNKEHQNTCDVPTWNTSSSS